MLNTEKNTATQATGSMRGKVVLITGGTGGIGRATAGTLAQMGATVLIVGRNEDTGRDALAAIRAKSSSDAVRFFPADISSQTDVRQLAQTVMEQYPRLDVLINNVGNWQPKRRETVDGVEMTLALNVLAPFLLTNLLLPTLKASAPSRIINVNSMVHRYGAGLNVADLQSKHYYRPMNVYSKAKYANLLFTYELSRRLAGTGVTVNAVDPGFTINAPDLRKSQPWFMWLAWPFMKLGSSIMTYFRASTSSVYAASSPTLANMTGKYITTAKKAVPSSKASYDEEMARKLWQACAELTGIQA